MSVSVSAHTGEPPPCLDLVSHVGYSVYKSRLSMADIFFFPFPPHPHTLTSKQTLTFQSHSFVISIPNLL